MRLPALRGGRTGRGGRGGVHPRSGGSQPEPKKLAGADLPLPAVLERRVSPVRAADASAISRTATTSRPSSSRRSSTACRTSCTAVPGRRTCSRRRRSSGASPPPAPATPRRSSRSSRSLGKTQQRYVKFRGAVPASSGPLFDLDVSQSSVAHPVFRRGGLTSNLIKAPSNALPRRRTLWTNSKKPRYSGNFSCEIPRCGRNHDLSSDQKPSIVLRWTSQNPSPSLIPGELSGRMADAVMLVAPLLQSVVDVVLVGVDHAARGDRGPDQRPDGRLLDVGQHADDDRDGPLDHPEDRRLLLLQRPPPRGPLQVSPAPISPFFLTASGCPLCPATT